MKEQKLPEGVKMMKKQELEKMLKNTDWATLYDQDNMRLQKIMPFEDRVRFNQYRFRFFINEIKKHGMVNPKIVDVGCHIGVFLKMLMNAGFKRVHGVDVSPATLQRAQKNTGLPESNFHEVNVMDESKELPDGEIIISSQVMEHVMDDKLFVKRLWDSVNKGGMLLISTPIEEQLNDPLHLHHYNFYDLCFLIRPHTEYFKIIKIHKTQKNGKPNVFVIKAHKR